MSVGIWLYLYLIVFDEKIIFMYNKKSKVKRASIEVL